jgi:hypothetical protein
MGARDKTSLEQKKKGEGLLPLLKVSSDADG